MQGGKRREPPFFSLVVIIDQSFLLERGVGQLLVVSMHIDCLGIKPAAIIDLYLITLYQVESSLLS